jgi:murein hydrolase activator
MTQPPTASPESRGPRRESPLALGARVTRFAFIIGLGLTTLAASGRLLAQDPPPGSAARRINDRIAALERESERLANEARTLVGDLRRLEVERDLRLEEARQATARAAETQQTLDRSTARLAELEQARIAQLPDLTTHLVDLYKRGRARYVRLLFESRDVREFARATRTVAALATLNERRVAEHRKMLDEARRERAQLEQQTRELQAVQAEARKASDAAGRAVASRTALVAQIDSRRDLTAQYVGELQLAHERLQQQTAAGAGRNEPIPLAPFRGALDWPVTGRVAAAFGQGPARGGTAITRNGIEIAAAEGTPVRAVHGGTVGFADGFTGFGTLVILDHGSNNYSLYGYLGSTGVSRGDTVESGAELGRVGLAPTGPPALYFEMRIDGRSVNPVQWLKPR